jgi:hypothetical protein
MTTATTMTAKTMTPTRRMIRRRAAELPYWRAGHVHRHGGGAVHVHRHDHDDATSHAVTPELDSTPPQHAHNHKTAARRALLLILGSSPMVEGIPAFFAAGKYGVGVSAMAAQHNRLRRPLRLLDGGFAPHESWRVRALRRSLERRFHCACRRGFLAVASRLLRLIPVARFAQVPVIPATARLAGQSTQGDDRRRFKGAQDGGGLLWQADSIGSRPSRTQPIVVVGATRPDSVRLV